MLGTLCRRFGRALFAACLIGTLAVPSGAQTSSPFYLDFDGVDDYLSVADSDALSFVSGNADTPLTFEMWVRPDGMTLKQNLVSRWLDGNNREYRLYMASGVIRLDLRDSVSQSTVSAYTSSSQTSLIGTWHHLAVTYDGRGGATAANGITFYIDGVSVSLTRANNASYVAMTNRAMPLLIGRESVGFQQYNGALDELRLWNVARTPTQILASKDIELSGTEPGLAAYWRFNEGTGATAADGSFGGHTATTLSGPTWVAGGPMGPAAPDLDPPVISNIATSNLTQSGVTITFGTSEPATGWVSYTENASCPCTDVFSAAVGATHTVTLTGLTPDTLYRYEVKASDAATNLQVAPILTFRTLAPQPDTTAPSITITRPVAGVVSGSVQVEALVTDAVGVAGVQFRVDGVALGPEDTAAPYSVSWDTITLADGPHTIAVEARDGANNISTSSLLVNVSNSPAATTPYYLDFDGINDYLDVPDVDTLSFIAGGADTPLTIELWFRPDSMAGKQSLVSKWLDGQNQEYRLYISLGAIRLDLRDSITNATVSAYTTASQASLLGTWHQLAVTYDGRGGTTAANGITIYVDGTAVPLTRANNPSYAGMSNRTMRVQIGRESSGFQQYDGALDELRLWNVARTRNEILAHMSLELAGTEPGLLAYWKMNEGAGTTVADHTSGAHTATMFNNPTWVSGGPMAPAITEAPAVTSGNSTSFSVGAAGTFAVTTTGSPVPTLSLSGTLPAGVTFTSNANGTGTLAGTPAPGSGGVYTLTITATNGVGVPATQSFTLTVTQPAAITSEASATFIVGAVGSFIVTTTGVPVLTVSMTGALPSGVTFTRNANGTATLSGTPAAGSGGTYALTLTATNGAGAPATQNFTLTVTQPPSITSAASTIFPAGAPGSFTVTTTGFPSAALASAGGLPAGVTLTDHGNGTATLSGTPAPGAGGTYTLTITATNGVGSSPTQSFTLTVTQPATITSMAATAFPVGSPGSFTLTSGGFPMPTLGATGMLPAGVSFIAGENGTATLAGTPAPGTGGVYNLTITATNGVGAAATQNFTLTVQACTVLPAGGSLPSATFGSPYALAFTAGGGAGHSFTVAAGSLPAGLTLANGGSLGGVPANTGVSTFTIAVTNSAGCVASNAYSITVSPDAHDEAFPNGVGNTQYSVGAGAPSTPAVVVSGTVLANDLGAGTLSAGPANITSAHGGHVAMSAAGTFLYTPPAGFGGPSDTFTYTVTDANGVSDSAIVTIALSGVVWYVNGTSGAGDGRSHNPFNTMPAASSAAQPSHHIYVHAGSPAGATTLKTGQALWGAGATFVVNGLAIGASSSPTLLGTVTLANNVVVSGISVNGGGGPAIAATGLTGTEVLSGVSIVGGSTGLQLTNLAGTLTMSGGAISGVSAGADVLVSGGTGAVAIGASIVNTGGRSVDIENRTAGTVTFSGAISDTGSGILLNANAGSTIAFTGGLALSTGANAAFTATGGGSVTVTQNNATIVNTIATTSGTALNVANTEIGSAGMTFRSIAAGSTSFSAGVGIVLDNTGIAGHNGGFTITGNGTAQSGGIIRRKTGPDGSTSSGVGIYLNSTKNVSLRWIDLNRFDNSAIVGQNVVGFVLADSVINTAGTTAGIAEGPLMFGHPAGVNGLLGTGILRNTLITGGVEDNVAFYSHSGAMTLDIERTGLTADCLIGSNATTTGGRGLLLQMDGSASATATINGCRFRNNRTAGLLASTAGDASLNLLITGSPTNDALKSAFSRASSQGQGQEGVVLTNAGNSDIVATIENSLITGFTGAGVWFGQAAGNASALSSLHVTITNNRIDSPFVSTSNGIVGRFSSSIGEVSDARVRIANNTDPVGLSQFGPSPAISLTTPDAGTTPSVNVTMAGNHIDMQESSAGSGSWGPIGINLLASNGSMCANIANNISHWYPSNLNPQGGGIRLTQAASALFWIERGSQPMAAAASAVLAGNNPAPSMTLMINEVFGSVAVAENGTCLLPTTR